MPLDSTQINQLVNTPRESLSLELKSWIDPNSNTGIAKIVKATLAMRNNDGGYLLIGFNNADGSANIDDAPDNVEQLFHVDKIQGYISRFSSEPFEVSIHYPVINSKNFVVIDIPKGVRTPVATKSSLDDSDKPLIRADKVFVRTLNANNTPSTAEAKWKDWPEITEKCFENRESDVGRFIRRHLSSVTSENFKEILSTLLESTASVQSTDSDNLIQFLKNSHQRYENIVGERKIELPKHGSMEVGVKINGEINVFTPNRDFLNLIMSTNPHYTGWPVWVDSSSFTNADSHPFVNNGTWEALITSLDNSFTDHIDYWRLSPDSQFYLYRAFQDDIGGSNRAPQPGTALDFGLAILRAAECVAVSIAFAKAMGCSEDSSINIVFKWSGLQGRILSSWTDPSRHLSYRKTAYQDEVVSTIEIPIDTAQGAVSGYVHQIISRLFEVFDGFELSENVTDGLVRRLFERRL